VSPAKKTTGPAKKPGTPSGRSGPAGKPAVDPAQNAVQRMPSGHFLPPNAVRSAVRVVVDATEHTDADIPEMVERFAYAQLAYPYIKPVFLISALEPLELTRAGFLYETVVPESGWDEVAMGNSYEDYKQRRFHEMITVYRAQRMGKVVPGEAVPRWMYER
jgi:hypothetical protein